MTTLLPHEPHRPLLWPDTLRDIQDALDDLNESLYIVGGAVRDALLQKPIQDIDLTTPGNAIALGRKIANRLKGAFFVLDDERDVSRILINTPDGRLVLDVAHFRGPDLLADLTDRDFTINAMAVELQGDLSQLIDPLNGEQDLRDKRIRRCSSQSIPSDPIRALRAVRQSVQLGAHIESATLTDVRAAGPRLNDTTAERLRDEFFKLLSLSRPAAALRVADALGLLQYVVPEVQALRGLQQSHPHKLDGWQHTLSVVEKMRSVLTTISPNRTEYSAAVFDLGMMVIALDRYRGQLQQHIDAMWPNDRPHEALLILGALMHDVGKPSTAQRDEVGYWRFLGHESVGATMAGERAGVLRLSNDEKNRLVMIVRNHMRPLVTQEWSRRAIHRFWRELGAAGVDVCLLSLADYLGAAGVETDQDGWLAHLERIRALLDAYFTQYEQVVAPPPLLDGNELMQALNLSPGPIVGTLLDLIREEQVEGEIINREDALRVARAYLTTHT